MNLSFVHIVADRMVTMSSLLIVVEHFAILTFLAVRYSLRVELDSGAARCLRFRCLLELLLGWMRDLIDYVVFSRPILLMK